MRIIISYKTLGYEKSECRVPYFYPSNYYIYSYSNIWGGRMIIIEKDMISVKYYDQIIHLDESNITIKMLDTIIEIQGKTLYVSYFTNIEVIVHGKFLNIQFI